MVEKTWPLVDLAEHIDPSLPGKTLVFCATDLHADTVVRLLKLAFAAAYGEVDDDAVIKITSSSSRHSTMPTTWPLRPSVRMLITPLPPRRLVG